MAARKELDASTPIAAFGNALYSLRIATGRTADELSSLLDPPIHRDTWFKWERGVSFPDPAKWPQIAALLGSLPSEIAKPLDAFVAKPKKAKKPKK